MKLAAGSKALAYIHPYMGVLLFYCFQAIMIITPLIVSEKLIDMFLVVFSRFILTGEDRGNNFYV